MTRVKICGITSAEDALAAAEAGADALGLIFVPGSPRYVSPDRAEAIVAAAPPFVAWVGVFADAPLDEVLTLAERLRLHAVQLHGSEPEAFSRRLPLPVIRAVRVRDAASLDALETYPARLFLLDAYAEGRLGGTGLAVPRDLALRAAARRPILLAGGLRPESVGEAVRAVRPYGVDVSSGVERSPGRKDHRKVREFIVNVRHTDLG